MLDPCVRHMSRPPQSMAELNRGNISCRHVMVVATTVDGFSEYFEDLAVEGRAGLGYHVAPTGKRSLTAYPTEFDVDDALRKRLFGEEERCDVGNARKCCIPQQMATIRDHHAVVARVFPRASSTDRCCCER